MIANAQLAKQYVATLSVATWLALIALVVLQSC